MIATSFDESNLVLNPPSGVSPDDCDALSVWVGKTEEGKDIVISCWKVTAEELEEIKRTGRVWVYVWGETMPPIAPSGMHPFRNQSSESQ